VVGLVVAAILIEAGVRTDVVWRPIVTLGAVGLALVLPWRRVQPLVTLAVTFGFIGALNVAGWVAAQECWGLGNIGTKSHAKELTGARMAGVQAARAFGSTVSGGAG
jgi:hypothetical protein